MCVNPTLDQLEAAIDAKIDEVTATLMWLSGIKEGTDIVLHADNGDWRCVFTAHPPDTTGELK
jgi:L-alanine-DL-glutamate epimerase-like enolase superfamily enzyme